MKWTFWDQAWVCFGKLGAQAPSVITSLKTTPFSSEQEIGNKHNYTNSHFSGNVLCNFAKFVLSIKVMYLNSHTLAPTFSNNAAWTWFVIW